MKLFKGWRKPKQKNRKYPIIEVEEKVSLRQYAFEQFENDRRPGEIARSEGYNPKTLYRYYQDYKKGDHHLRERSQDLRKRIRQKPHLLDMTVKNIADALIITPEAVKDRLAQPYALYHLLQGKWPEQPMRQSQDRVQERLEAALRIVVWFEKAGHDPDQIRLAVLRIDEQLRRDAGLPPRTRRHSVNDEGHSEGRA